MFSATVSSGSGEVAVRLGGELDVVTLPCLEGVVEGLVAAGATALVFDCSDVTFIDWIALRRVTSLARDAATAGVALDVCNLSSFTHEVLEASGLPGREVVAGHR